MTTSKLEIEKFDGKCDFNLWKMNVQALLENLGLKEVIIDTKKNDNYNYIRNLEESKEPNNFESR